MTQMADEWVDKLLGDKESSSWLPRLLNDFASWQRREAVADSDIERVTGMFRSTYTRQHVYAHPMQRPMFYMPGLRAKPWWDEHELPGVRALISNVDMIRAEAQAAGGVRTHPEGHLFGLDETAWSILSLLQYGQQNETNCALLPRTTALLLGLADVRGAGYAYLSRLAPGTYLRPHFGPTNVRLRCQLGLSIPSDCWIRVGPERRVWEEGRCLVFDESFVHEVRNGSDTSRDILIVDFWHPDLTAVERAALQFLSKYLFDIGVLRDR